MSDLSGLRLSAVELTPESETALRRSGQSVGAILVPRGRDLSTLRLASGSPPLLFSRAQQLPDARPSTVAAAAAQSGMSDLRVATIDRACEVQPHCPVPVRLLDGTGLARVGIVVTCHDYGRYLPTCLDSVLAQTHRPIDVVLVDDASTDDTPAIAAAYAARGVRYLRVEFRDVARSRNAGAAMCEKPEYFLFVDADDALPIDYVEVLLAGMRDVRIGVAYAYLDRWDGEKSLGRIPSRDYELWSLRRSNYINACSLIRRKAFEQVGGWQSYRHGLQDWDLWLRIGEAGWQMSLCDVDLHYRVHGVSMTDKRRASWVPQVRVIRRAQTTAIVTLFCGRSWHLDRYFEAVKNLDWDKKNLHLVAVDNSPDDSFSRLLLSHLANGSTPFSYVRERRQLVRGIAAKDLADNAQLRIEHTYAMGQHLARLYALATKHLPACAAKVWSIEDDVEVLPDSLTGLMTALLDLRAGAVVGTMRSRFSNHLLVRRRRQRPSKVPAGPVTVTEHGFYCLLTYRDVWDSIAWRPGDAGQSPYYDWAAAHDIWRHGPTYLVPSVRCRHWQANGSCLTV